MRKVISLVLIAMLLMGSAAFADHPALYKKPNIKPADHSVATTFFDDLKKLFTEQIPNTPKSATYGLNRTVNAKQK